jgi:tetratricopeptide (TPR) repeat protein
VTSSLGAWLFLGGCVSPKPFFSDSDWIAHTTTGKAAYQRGDLRAASDAHALAQKRAEALDDAEALAVASVNRAVVLLADGKQLEARSNLADSLADVRVSPRRRTELLSIEARSLYELGDLDASLLAIASALQLSPYPRIQAQLHLVQCSVFIQQGKAEAAQSILDGAFFQKQLESLFSAIQAEHAELNARIAETQGRHQEAMKSYDAASILWKEAARLPKMARALANAGRQAKLFGDGFGAGDRLYRSARSLWAQGMADEALSVMGEATEIAATAEDHSLGRRLAEWLSAVSESHPK